MKAFLYLVFVIVLLFFCLPVLPVGASTTTIPVSYTFPPQYTNEEETIYGARNTDLTGAYFSEDLVAVDSNRLAIAYQDSIGDRYVAIGLVDADGVVSWGTPVYITSDAAVIRMTVMQGSSGDRRLIICWGGDAVVGIVHDDTLTLGVEQQFDVNGLAVNSVVTLSTGTTLAISYFVVGITYKFILGTCIGYTNTVITFGTAVTTPDLDMVGYPQLYADHSSAVFCVLYKADDGTVHGRTLAATYSGTVPTFGTEDTFVSGGVGVAEVMQTYRALVFDHNPSEATTDNKLIIVRQEEDTGGDISEYLTMGYWDTAGKSFTFGPDVQIGSTVTPDYNKIWASLNICQSIEEVSFYVTSTANTDFYPGVYYCTVEDDDFTIGTFQPIVGASALSYYRFIPKIVNFYSTKVALLWEYDPDGTWTRDNVVVDTATTPSIIPAGYSVAAPSHPTPPVGAPTLIHDQADLQAIGGDADGYYVLANDITITGSWTPLDNFHGYFDGDDFTIGTLDNPFLLLTTYGCVVVDTTIVVDLTSSAAFGHVGGFVGMTSDWSGEGSVCDSVFYNCHVSGEITMSGGHVAAGGFAVAVYDDKTYSRFTNCTAEVNITITGSSGFVGGFFGETAAPCLVVDCSSNSVITTDEHGCIGGFVGGTSFFETYQGCSAAGSITVDIPGTPSGVSDIGGFNSYSSNNETFNHCSTSVDINFIMADSVPDAFGGFVGFTCWNEHFIMCSATGDITFDFTESSYTAVGGFTGYSCSYELYERCWSEGNITNESTHPNSLDAGGFVGYFTVLHSVVRDCYSVSNVALYSDDVNSDIGGFVGVQDTVTNGSFSTTNCYFAGSLDLIGDGSLSGFANDNGGNIVVTACFWDTTHSGVVASDFGVGHITSWMTTQTNYSLAGWDFSTPIWYQNVLLNDGYPILTFTNANIPQVKTEVAVNIQPVSATIQGILVSIGTYNPVYASLEYGTSTSYGKPTGYVTMGAAGAFSSNITGLTAGTVYHYRANATYLVNGAPLVVHGDDETFTAGDYVGAKYPTPGPGSGSPIYQEDLLTRTGARLTAVFEGLSTWATGSSSYGGLFAILGLAILYFILAGRIMIATGSVQAAILLSLPFIFAGALIGVIPMGAIFAIIFIVAVLFGVTFLMGRLA